MLTMSRLICVTITGKKAVKVLLVIGNMVHLTKERFVCVCVCVYK